MRDLDDDGDYDDNGYGNADLDVYYDEDTIAEPDDSSKVVVQEQRPKPVRLIGPINSLDSALDESHYTKYAPDIPPPPHPPLKKKKELLAFF